MFVFGLIFRIWQQKRRTGEFYGSAGSGSMDVVKWVWIWQARVDT